MLLTGDLTAWNSIQVHFRGISYFYAYGIFERTSEHENSTCLFIYLIPKCYAVFLCGKEKEGSIQLLPLVGRKRTQASYHSQSLTALNKKCTKIKKNLQRRFKCNDVFFLCCLSLPLFLFLLFPLNSSSP